MTTDDPGSVPLPSRKALKELRERALASTDRKERRRLLDEWRLGQARRRFDQTARQLLRSGDPRAAALAASIAAHAGTTLPAPSPAEPAPAAPQPAQPRRAPRVDPGDTRPAAQILAATFDAPPGFIATLAALDDVTREVQLTQITQKRPDLAALIRRALVEHQAHDDDDLDDA